MARRRKRTPDDNRQTELFPGLPTQTPAPRLRRISHALWTENKAKLIQRYLYYFVMITHHGTYIDGFAGPQNPRRPGTWAARLVLHSKPKWLRHVFLFDLNREQIRLLRALRIDKHSQAPSREIRIYHGDFNSKVRVILKANRISQREATFCLLDQRTFECHWKTAKKLARYKRGSQHKIELFYFLAIRWLHRALAGTKDTGQLQRWWGRADWRELRGLSQDQVRDRVVARFTGELGYKSAVPWPIFEKRGSDIVMYYMIHASDHPEAPRLMDRAYNKVVKPKESYEQLSLELGLPLPQAGDEPGIRA
jgi:three-Cys-motif partner protein